MIIHRTTYALFYKESDKANIIIDCKRSANNAAKIYHHIKNAEIYKSYMYNNNKLTETPTSQEYHRTTKLQRNIAKGKPYETS